MKSSSRSLPRALEIGAQIVMGLALLTLPFTSLPALSKPMGGTTVAPLSIVFLLLLAVGWLPVYILKGGSLPREFRPFLIFVAVALIASAAAFFLPIPPYKSHTVTDAELKALFTFAIGCAAYFVIAIWHREPGQFKIALWMLNLGGALILVWSFIELYFVLFKHGQYADSLVLIQRLLSSRDLFDPGFRDRVGGFTYEPSWLAHQLNVVYIPYWLAATVTGYSTARKFRRLSLENLLLLGGVAIMYFTASRVGLVAFLLVLAYMAYRLNLRLIAWLEGRIQLRLRDRTAQVRERLRISTRILLTAGLLAVYVGAFFAGLYLLPLINHRFGDLTRSLAYLSNPLEFAYQVGFAERVVYWASGWSLFARYPILGVGLGNAGFYFTQFLPNLSYHLGEILTLIYQAPDLPNIKSMWMRLLAETGLVGFSFFVAWQYQLWQAAHFLRSNSGRILRTLGWMGAFALVAFLAEGFSIDSFALPYLWVSTGLLTAAVLLARRESK